VFELRIPIGKVVIVERGCEDFNLTVDDYELVQFYLKAFKPLSVCLERARALRQSYVGQTHTFTSCNGVLTLVIFRIYFM
jgi:hypothetical protein